MRTLRLLLVDDDAISREMMAYFIKSSFTECDLEIDEAENGLEACVRLQERQYDLVLLDLMMPVQDGFRTIEKIRALPTSNDVPIIVVSSVHQEKQVMRALKLGATDFVRKPFIPAELVMRIRNQLPSLADCMDSAQQ